MEPKRVASKETIERNIEEAIDKASIYFPVYADTQLFIEKRSSLTRK